MSLARSTMWFLAAVFLFTSTSNALAQSIHDEFDDGLIDAGLWTSGGTAPGASVVESGSTLKLHQRGILVSNGAFPDLDVRGRFRFSGTSNDRFVVFTRSSGTYQANPYNDLDNGIAFVYQRPIDAIEIGAYSYPNVSSQLAVGTSTLPLNTWIDFRVRDDGFNVELYIHDLVTPALTATTPLSFGQRLAFSNREYAGCETEIDAVDVRRVWKQNPANGHWYMGTGIRSWTDAEQYAVSLGGHLPTIRGLAENDWLRDRFAAALTSGQGLWIGLNDVAVEGTFVWTSGESAVYTNWDSGEPNNAGGIEDAVHMRSPGDGGTFGRWNDEVTNTNPRMGMVEVVSSDCDGNRIPDVTEILASPGSDVNGNGVLDACECGVHNACVSHPNSTGIAAQMSLAGLPSISLDSFTLLCMSCPPSTSGVFYYGTQSNQVPFGNGYRCVSGVLARTPITLTSSGGIAARTLSLSTPPHSLNLTVGSVRYFQFWYRDVSAGGSLFDLSDSLVVQFCP